MAFPWLPALMAGLGATGAGMSAFGKSRPERQIRMGRYTPGQESGLDQLLGMGLQNVDLGPIEQRAMQQFQQETVPSLAERFTSMGGGQRSSAFGSTLGRAGGDLSSQLAALRPQLGMQQLQMGMQPRFESIFQPQSPGGMQQLGAGLMGAGMSGLMPAMQLRQQQKQFGQQMGSQNEMADLLRQLLSQGSM